MVRSDISTNVKETKTNIIHDPAYDVDNMENPIISINGRRNNKDNTDTVHDPGNILTLHVSMRLKSKSTHASLLNHSIHR